MKSYLNKNSITLQNPFSFFVSLEMWKYSRNFMQKYENLESIFIMREYNL
jgi:hypothetical protein